MTRALPSATEAAIAQERGYALVYLLELHYSGGGVLRLATAPSDIAWDSETWDAIGGHLQVGDVQETGDDKAQGVELELSGVDQTVISAVLSNHVRGQECTLWRAQLDEDAGTIVDAPQQVFRGFQNEPYEIEAKRGEGLEGGTVTVRTRIVSRTAVLQQTRQTLANPTSHNDLLERAGLAASDTFFHNTSEISGRPIYWGDVEEPDE